MMQAIAANTNLDRADTKREPIAPWWHSVLVLAAVAGLASASAHEHGLPNLHLRWVNPRLSSYYTVISAEWLLVLVIWIPLRQRGRTLSSVVSGRWPSPRAFFRDVGLAIAFFAVVTIPISLLTNRLAAHGDDATMRMLLPKTVFELLMWLAMSVTVGYCEEFIFRGYLAEQFSAWSSSRGVGIVGQAVCFGLAHLYYNKGVIVAICFLGLFLGLLCQWRKSLRPAMLMHGMQDAVGGIVGFFSHP